MKLKKFSQFINEGVSKVDLTLEEGNKLISDFLGCEYKEFHNSIDLLNKVLDKIDTIDIRNHTDWPSVGLWGDDLKEQWEDIVRFILWYNENY